MALTLADYRGYVRGLLVDTQYDATLIDQAINWFVYELCNNNRLRVMEASDELFASQGDTLVEFPEDMVTLIKEGFYMIVPKVIEMGTNYVEYGNFMRNYANFATAPQAQAYQWTDYNNQARFTAPLNASHTFQCDYLREPTLMNTDASECDLPDRYQELITKGSLARIMDINEDYQEAKQERDNYAPLMTTFIRNESRGGFKTGGTVMRTNRGKGAWRADRDYR